MNLAWNDYQKLSYITNCIDYLVNSIGLPMSSLPYIWGSVYNHGHALYFKCVCLCIPMTK